MYIKHVLLYVFIVLIITIIACHYYYEEGYKHIVIGVTAGFILITMALLAVWMADPKDFSVPKRTVEIEIQNMDETVQVVYTASEEFDKIVEKLENIKMLGSFKELTNVERAWDVYRVTFLDKKGREIDTYYFINKYYMVKKKGKGYVYYRWTEDHRFPYDFIANMYESAIHQ